MIRIQKSLDRSQKMIVGFSGGSDSVAAADFLYRKHKIDLLFVHHGQENDDQALEEVCYKFANDRGLNLIVKRIDPVIPRGRSLEDYWRQERYKVYHSYDCPVITCHTLDDCVETWVWSSLHGNGKIIPYAHKNVIRPFRTIRKNDFIDWSTHKSLTWYEDYTNKDTRFVRNHIRHNMMPDILKVNPGIHKVVLKKVLLD